MLYDKSLFEKAYNTLKLKFIYREIQNIENIRILELGVRRGLSTSLFLKTCEDNNGRMISIDIDDCGHLFKNDRWNFICTRDDDYEKIDKEILKIGGLDVVYIDSLHEPNHVKKIFYHYYNILKKGGFIFIDDISWLPYAKSAKHESSGNYEANIKTFEKLLEIHFNNIDKFNIEFSFDGSGTAKIIKNDSSELNEPKKIKKSFTFKNFILTIYKKFFNKNY
jgi:predicted O-methyltransferase YrrM